MIGSALRSLAIMANTSVYCGIMGRASRKGVSAIAIGKCGIICSECSYAAEANCSGCEPSAGNMSWGTCELAKYAISKEVSNCAYCRDFVCDMLHSFAYHKEHGDNGARIENLKKYKV